MTKLTKALGTDLASIAELLRSKGRGKDTMLAHITPREAALLKRRGGSGSINPDTGLPEFEDSGDYSFEAPAPASPVYDVVQPSGQFQPTTGEGASAQTAGAPYNENITNAGGSYSALPGETGDIPAYQAAGQNQPVQLVSRDASGNAQYGFPTIPSAQLPATNVETPTPAELVALQKGGPQDPAMQTPSYLDKAAKALTDPGTLTKLGLATGLGLYGASRARQGGSQVQQVQGQQQAIASPYQQQGAQLVQQAQQGVLAPASQQAYNAAKAQLEQSKANRGGVGSQQASAQLADTYQRLLDNQYNYGLKVMQIGDNIALGAIKSGLTLDQNLNTATTNFYTQLASMVGGMPISAGLPTAAAQPRVG